MKTPTLVAGTALLGIAIGFVVGNMAAGPGHAGREEAAAENSSRTKSSSRRSGGGTAADTAGRADSVASGFGSGREYGKMSAKDALAMVKANADLRFSGDPVESARKNYEYQLMLSKLPLSEMESLIALSKEEGVPTYRLRNIFAHYAGRDLDRAMAWAAGQPDADAWKSIAVGATAVRDPGRAMEMYQESLMGGVSSYPGNFSEGVYSLAENAARQGKDALFHFLDSVPSSGASNYVSNVLRSLPKEDLPGFLEELDQRVKAGKMDQWTMSNTLQNLASSDPAMVRSLIEKMEPGPERSKREITLAASLSQQGKTDEALELVRGALAREPGKEKEVFLDQAGSMYSTPTNFITRMAEMLPPGVELTVEDVKNLGNRSGRSDPVGMAKLLKSPDDQSAYLEEVIRSMDSRGPKPNETDFRVLENRIRSLGLTGANAEAVQTQLEDSRRKVLGK